MQTTAASSSDVHAQLRALYQLLLEDQERFEEFRELLASYPATLAPDQPEPPAATEVRERLNRRIREWTQGSHPGLTAQHMVLWRGIVVDERVNIALSPWRESNSY